MATGSRTYASRENEFLKFAPPGIEYRRNIVLDHTAFPSVVVEEGNVTSKAIVRKGQLLVKNTSNDKYLPYGRAVATATAASSGSTVTVNDARPFVAGQTVTVNGGSNKTIASVNYATNVITFTTTVGAAVSVGHVVLAGGDAGTVAPNDMCVAGYEVDLTYGDEPCAGYFLHCIFNTANLIGYAGNETAVQTAMPTCLFGE